MITKVSIANFRGVRQGGVEGLAPISILVGPNNSGKSTVLEAIALMSKEGMPEQVARLLLRRGGPRLDAFEHAVHVGETEAVIEVTGAVKVEPESVWRLTMSRSRVATDVPGEDGKPVKGAKTKLVTQLGETFRLMPSERPGGRRPKHEPAHELYVTDDGQLAFGTHHTTAQPFPSTLVDLETVRGHEALEDAHASIGKANRLDVVVRSLQRAMPGLTGLVVFKSGSDFVLHTARGSARPVSAYLAGDGFKRFLAVAAAALDPASGAVLLEEPEAYQHPRYLEELATLLHLAARDGVQIILSTHSVELIDFLLHAPEAEGQSYPAVHRMGLNDGKLSATTLDREHALTVRDDLLQDLRA